MGKILIHQSIITIFCNKTNWERIVTIDCYNLFPALSSHEVRFQDFSTKFEPQTWLKNLETFLRFGIACHLKTYES